MSIMMNDLHHESVHIKDLTKLHNKHVDTNKPVDTTKKIQIKAKEMKKQGNQLFLELNKMDLKKNKLNEKEKNRKETI